MSQSVKRDGSDDNQSCNDLLPVTGHAPLLTTSQDHAHYQRANDSTEYGTFPTGEAASADYNGGNHIQFESDGSGRVANGQTRVIHQARYTGKGTAEGKNNYLDH